MGAITILLLLAGIACAVGLWLLFRSFRRWKEPTPVTEEGKQALMRLSAEAVETQRF